MKAVYQTKANIQLFDFQCVVVVFQVLRSDTPSHQSNLPVVDLSLTGGGGQTLLQFCCKKVLLLLQIGGPLLSSGGGNSATAIWTHQELRQLSRKSPGHSLKHSWVPSICFNHC